MVKNGKQEGIVRIVALVVVLLNQILVTLGYNPLPFSDEQIYEGLSLAFMVLAVVWATWKNNNLTEEALEGQKKVEELKGVKK